MGASRRPTVNRRCKKPPWLNDAAEVDFISGEAPLPYESERVGSLSTAVDAERVNGLFPGDSVLPMEDLSPSEALRDGGGDGATRCFLDLRAGLSLMALGDGRADARAVRFLT